MAGRSIPGPDFVSTCRTKLCASSVAYTSGAPSACRSKGGLARTQYLRSDRRAQGRKRSRPHRRQTDHDDRLGIAKRRRIIEAQVEFVFLGQRHRRNVLILRGVRGAENARHIDDRADIGTVVAAPGVGVELICASKSDDGARGKRRDHGLAVSVVEYQLIGILREARHLLRAGLVEALLIEAHVQAARQHRGARLQLFGIAV